MPGGPIFQAQYSKGKDACREICTQKDSQRSHDPSVFGHVDRFREEFALVGATKVIALRPREKRCRGFHHHHLLWACLALACWAGIAGCGGCNLQPHQHCSGDRCPRHQDHLLGGTHGKQQRGRVTGVSGIAYMHIQYYGNVSEVANKPLGSCCSSASLRGAPSASLQTFFSSFGSRSQHIMIMHVLRSGVFGLRDR